jgi:hypothetical protein
MNHFHQLPVAAAVFGVYSPLLVTSRLDRESLKIRFYEQLRYEQDYEKWHPEIWN